MPRRCVNKPENFWYICGQITKNIIKLYPVKKFTVLIFNSYPNNCHFKRISLTSFYRISNVQTI